MSKVLDLIGNIQREDLVSAMLIATVVSRDSNGFILGFQDYKESYDIDNKDALVDNVVEDYFDKDIKHARFVFKFKDGSERRFR